MTIFGLFKRHRSIANKAKKLASVQEVVQCGSMAAGDPYPGDIDLAVVLSNLDGLSQLARFCRQISPTTPGCREKRWFGRMGIGFEEDVTMISNQEERKLIWIMPVLVRQDKGWPEQGRINQ